VQDGGEDHADRLKVDQIAQFGASQDGGGLSQISGYDGDAVAGEDRAGVGEDDRIVVDVGDLGGRVGVLGDLVDARGGG
jgi:hypothetical protein